MIIPVPALWSRQTPEDPDDRINRVLFNRNHRLMAGISVDQGFHRVYGVLMVSVGRGKYVRLKHTVECVVDVPQVLAQGCRDLIHSDSINVADSSSLLSDLAEVQALTIEKIKCHAGKYVDRVMAVSVVDPGLWNQDFDGRFSYSSLCDVTRLAELSGVTVVDAFPSRDIAVGGNGSPIDALPLWLLMADRNEKVANQRRAVLIATDKCAAYQLPPSDGLDADLAIIKPVSVNGLRFLTQQFLTIAKSKSGANDLEKLYADGRSDKSLYEQLTGLLESSSENSAATDDQLQRVSSYYCEQQNGRLADLIRTSVCSVVDYAVDQFRLASRPDLNISTGRLSATPIESIYVAAHRPLESCIINRLQQILPTVELQSTSAIGVSPSHLDAVVAGILGLLHIDQMPANVPWLTGADSQRILGRLTPGRPANWRQLIRSMADFHPPAMKLKDAI